MKNKKVKRENIWSAKIAERIQEEIGNTTNRYLFADLKDENIVREIKFEISQIAMKYCPVRFVNENGMEFDLIRFDVSLDEENDKQLNITPVWKAIL